MLGAYSALIDIFVNFYEEETRYAVFTYASILIKITSPSQQRKVAPNTFEVE